METSKEVGQDFQDKVCVVDALAQEAGFTLEQRKLVLGLIDHESAGTWSESVVGDGGCSVGIAQWNSCAGRIAPDTFQKQAELIVAEMKDKFSSNSNDWAVSKHNSPYGSYKSGYVSKVIKASELFN